MDRATLATLVYHDLFKDCVQCSHTVRFWGWVLVTESYLTL